MPRQSTVPPLQPLVRLNVDLDVELTTTGFVSVVLSPDGRRLAYVSRGRLFTRMLDQPDAIELTAVAGANSPFFSPDGRWIVYYAGNHLQKKASVDGGAPIDIVQTTAILPAEPGPSAASWSRRLARVGPLLRIDEGNAPVPLTTLAEGDRNHRSPAPAARRHRRAVHGNA